MQVDTPFIQNKGYKLSQFSVCMYSERQKKRRSIKEKMERPMPMKREDGITAAATGDVMFQLQKLYTL
jgi:hypothetical protein